MVEYRSRDKVGEWIWMGTGMGEVPQLVYLFAGSERALCSPRVPVGC